MIKFAVISFPGTNCEKENVRAFKRNGMDAEIVLWNDPGMLDGTKCKEFDGYCIAGGFSYEDRGRSGIVAAQDPVMKVIMKEAELGKIVLGICNGAQILVETGLIPGFEDNTPAVALAWNEMRVQDEIVATGFYNSWAYLKNVAPKGRCAFNDFDELLHIPFAHGEGRFMMEASIMQKLEENKQIVFKYSDEGGTVSPDFPITPNGAMAATAAICNPAGNVMAIMPHPERDPKGNGGVIFESIRCWIEEGRKTDHKPLGKIELHHDIRPLPDTDFDVLVRLIITDNTERTLEDTFQRNGFKLNLDRYDYFGVRLNKSLPLEEAAQEIMLSGELANFNKHLVYIRTKEGVFSYDVRHGLRSKNMDFDTVLIAADKNDFVGQSKRAAINRHAGDLVKNLQYGTLWNIRAESDLTDLVVDSRILYNPQSMFLMKS